MLKKRLGSVLIVCSFLILGFGGFTYGDEDAALYEAGLYLTIAFSLGIIGIYYIKIDNTNSHLNWRNIPFIDGKVWRILAITLAASATLAFVNLYALTYSLEFLMNLSRLLNNQVFLLGIFLVGISLFIFRHYARSTYGISEVFVGLYLANSQLTNIQKIFDSFQLLSIVFAGIYIIVRGMDNIHQGYVSKTNKDVFIDLFIQLSTKRPSK